jgi:hypothetical protein
MARHPKSCRDDIPVPGLNLSQSGSVERLIAVNSRLLAINLGCVVIPTDRGTEQRKIEPARIGSYPKRLQDKGYG